MDALLLAAIALLAALAAVIAVRKRSARRAAEARERVRQRRRTMPVVSANVCGLPRGDEPDLWAEDMPARKDRVA